MDSEVHFREDEPRVETSTPPTTITSNDLDVIIEGWELKFEHLSRCMREIQLASEKASTEMHNMTRDGRARESLGTRAPGITTTLGTRASEITTTLGTRASEITTTLGICATTTIIALEIGAGITDPMTGLHTRTTEGIAAICSATHTMVG